MGCFAFKSGKRPRAQRPSGARTPPAKSAPAVSDSSSSSGGGAHSKSKASSASASTPTRSIQELSEERGAQRLRVFDLDELASAFFRSAAGARVVLAVKQLNQRSLQWIQKPASKDC